MTLLAAIKRCPELSQEQCALRTAWDRLEEEVRKSTVDNKQRVQTLSPQRGFCHFYSAPLLHPVLCFLYMFLAFVRTVFIIMQYVISEEKWVKRLLLRLLLFWTMALTDSLPCLSPDE